MRPDWNVWATAAGTPLPRSRGAVIAVSAAWPRHRVPAVPRDPQPELAAPGASRVRWRPAPEDVGESPRAAASRRRAEASRPQAPQRRLVGCRSIGWSRERRGGQPGLNAPSPRMSPCTDCSRSRPRWMDRASRVTRRFSGHDPTRRGCSIALPQAGLTPTCAASYTRITSPSNFGVAAQRADPRRHRRWTPRNSSRRQ